MSTPLISNSPTLVTDSGHILRRDGRLYVPVSTPGIGSCKSVPPDFLRKLKVIDRCLTCEYHDFYEKYMVIRRLSKRVEDVLCAVDYEHLEGNESTKLLNELRTAYNNRKPAETTKGHIDKFKKGIAAVRKKARDAFEGIATREIEAGCAGAKVYAQGSETPVIGNRVEGMVGKD